MHWILYFAILLLTSAGFSATASQPANGLNDSSAEPVTMAVAGLSHGHAHWIFQDHFAAGDYVIGVYEPDEELVRQFINNYNLDRDLFFDDLDEMLDELQPSGLLAFGAVYDHLSVVEAAAPRGVHVMVEKPLAVSLDHAMQMKALAEDHGIHLLTNYETSWYPSTEKTKQLFTQNREDFGEIRKAMFHHGHMGPKEIGVGPEFLDWLIDPVLNGGGALMDFGCYGANLMTWLTTGEQPHTVTAVTQTHKPEIYAEVDDEATIIVTYPESQAIIQASWNWPIDRKDMEIYGVDGYVKAPASDVVDIRRGGESETVSHTVSAGEVQLETDPFHYFAGVIRGEIEMPPYSLYTLENNMLVMQILESAKKSAETGRTIELE